MTEQSMQSPDLAPAAPAGDPVKAIMAHLRKRERPTTLEVLAVASERCTYVAITGPDRDGVQEQITKYMNAVDGLHGNPCGQARIDGPKRHAEGGWMAYGLIETWETQGCGND